MGGGGNENSVLEHNPHSKAFTLAEALIALAIIGVVAALTIPSIISRTQQTEFKTGLRKAVSVLNNSINLSINLDGIYPSNFQQIDCPNIDQYHMATLMCYLTAHMSIIKTKTGMATTTYGYDEKGKNYRNLVIYSQNTAFYTTDGMRFEFWTAKPQNLILYETGVHIGKGPHSHDMYSYYSGCGSYGLLDNPNNSIVTPCIISVDVNGDRKPNPKEYNHLGQFTRYEIHPTSEKFGDIFSIMITDNGAVPYGYQAQKAMYGKN